MFVYILSVDICFKVKFKINGVGKYIFFLVNLVKLWKEGKIRNKYCIFNILKKVFLKRYEYEFYSKDGMFIKKQNGRMKVFQVGKIMLVQVQLLSFLQYVQEKLEDKVS